MALMRSQICAEIIVQAFRGFITFLILVHHRFSGADHPRLNVAVGNARGYKTLDLHSKTGQADFPRPVRMIVGRIPLTASSVANSGNGLARRSIGAAFSERAMLAYHAGVFCIPLPTHVRLARDYRPHVDRATPGDPPCRSATPLPEVVRLIC